MNVSKGTICFLSSVGHYNIVYMSKDIAEFNCDCTVKTLPYLNPINGKYIAVSTKSKNIGIYEQESVDQTEIIVWIIK